MLAHEWVATRGGVVPRLLQPTVVRGAANVASVRRLRNLVHGVVALNRVVAPEPGPSAPGLGGAVAGGGAPGSPGGSLHRPGESSPMDRCDGAPVLSMQSAAACSLCAGWVRAHLQVWQHTMVA